MLFVCDHPVGACGIPALQYLTGGLTNAGARFNNQREPGVAVFNFFANEDVRGHALPACMRMLG